MNGWMSKPVNQKRDVWVTELIKWGGVGGVGNKTAGVTCIY